MKQRSFIPNRNKRNLELLHEEIEYQKSFQKEDSDRACHLPIKKFRIFADIYRNKLRKYDKVSDLINYNVMNNHN
jgi:hypothetical protein